MIHGTQYDTLWLLKNCMLYIVCTLNVPNPVNPIIKSRLIQLWMTKCFHAHSKSFLLEFKIAKRLPPRKSSFYIVIYVICHHFLFKMVHLWCAYTQRYFSKTWLPHLKHILWSCTLGLRFKDLQLSFFLPPFDTSVGNQLWMLSNINFASHVVRSHVGAKLTHQTHISLKCEVYFMCPIFKL